MIPGEIMVAVGDHILNAGCETQEMMVENTSDRLIQVGSHCHFFEVNAALRFDRVAARGFRLDVSAGTTIRFEPGRSRKVGLVKVQGRVRD